MPDARCACKIIHWRTRGAADACAELRVGANVQRFASSTLRIRRQHSSVSPIRQLAVAIRQTLDQSDAAVTRA
jgi:hypothetical protein